MPLDELYRMISTIPMREFLDGNTPILEVSDTMYYELMLYFVTQRNYISPYHAGSITEMKIAGPWGYVRVRREDTFLSLIYEDASGFF